MARKNRRRPKKLRHSSHGTYEMSGLSVTGFGLLSGLIAGMFGIGGGFIKGPVIVLGFGMPAKIAAPTALFMITITSLTGSIFHYLLGHIQWMTLFLAAAFVLGAIIGNKAGFDLSKRKIERIDFSQISIYSPPSQEGIYEKDHLIGFALISSFHL